MTDTELARALERGEIAPEHFHHDSHLQVAWAYLCESSSVEEAATKMRRVLQRITAAAGKPEKYHETITSFWLRLLDRARSRAAHVSLEELLRAHPQLLEKDFPLTYYSRARLFSETARGDWVEPDLKPLSSQCDCV